MSFFSFFNRDYYQEMTRAVNDWWASIYKPSDFYDVIEVPLTVHLCGSEEVIEREASKLVGHKIDYPGTAGLAPRIGKQCHLFVVVAKDISFATTEIQYFAAGHELAHFVDMINEEQGARITDYPNPDEFHT